jgi:hypothetical protein
MSEDSNWFEEFESAIALIIARCQYEIEHPVVRDGRTSCCDALTDEGKCCNCRRPINVLQD